MLRVAYFVHDLTDAAVLRRVRMLHAGGARVIVIGFRRHAGETSALEGVEVMELGTTLDGRLLHRIGAILRAFTTIGEVRRRISGADTIIARNLESLVLATRLKGGRLLAYECLDVHRTLLETSLSARIVQRVERLLLAQVDLIVTSSPRFRDDYFRRMRRVTVPIILLENKVLQIDAGSALQTAERPAPGPPWVIGWFGMLRCRRTLEQLEAIVRASSGRVEVLVAGIASGREFDDFEARVASIPGMTFLGRYTAAQISALYARVHFAWAIDYFEEGLNSNWLLPNRLYEALAHRVVPIAQKEVETGRWLARHGVGLIVDNVEKEVRARLTGLNEPTYRSMRDAIGIIPREALIADAGDCRSLVQALTR